MIILINTILLSLYFILKYFDPNSLKYFVYEDSFGETLQFAFFLMTSIIVFKKRSLFKEAKWGHAQAYAISLMFLWVALEEISYGQRIFNFRLVSLQVINYQNETNIHNLVNLRRGGLYYIIFIALFALLIPLVEFLLNKKKLVHTFFLQKNYIISFLTLGVFYFLLPHRRHMYFYEFTELNISLIFFYLAIKTGPLNWS